jgi:hypothetical protein
VSAIKIFCSLFPVYARIHIQALIPYCRFGETLPQAQNILQISPFESSTRHLRHVSDGATYKKLHATLPAVQLSAFKMRVRQGEPKAIQELWQRRDKTFLALDFEWSERNEKTCLEWGYAAVRCGHLSS